MAMRSEIDKRAKRYAAKQCVADHGMHRDARAHVHRVPVLDNIEECHYHRPPTQAEIRFGHGATHYAIFRIEECCYPGTRIAKRWFVSPYDGLRYYR